MLEHYGHIKDAANPVMTAYTSDAMTIEYGKLAARKQYVYAFEPKVGAGEGRKRLVGMHTASKEAIGLVSWRVGVCTLGATAGFEVHRLSVAATPHRRTFSTQLASLC